MRILFFSFNSSFINVIYIDTDIKLYKNHDNAGDTDSEEDDNNNI